MKRANVWLIAGLLVVFAQGAVAATCSSLSSGNWRNSLVWSCGAQPTATDMVIINSPHTITLDVQSVNAAALTIDAGGIIDDNGKKLTVSGNIMVNGQFGLAGDGTLISTGNSTISGTGTFFTDSKLKIRGSATIPVGAALTFTGQSKIKVVPNATLVINGAVSGAGQQNGNTIIKAKGSVTINGQVNAALSRVHIEKNVTFTNNGSAILQSVKGKNNTSVWTNGVNSTLDVSQTLFGTGKGTLNAQATGNTVNYSGKKQTVMLPSGAPALYYHLTLSGSDAVNLPSGMTIIGNFTMSGTATTIAPATLMVGGNLSIGTGNTFTPDAGTVTLNGASIQAIGGGTTDLSLFNLAVNNPAGITLARNVIVTGTLTGLVTLTSTCPSDYTLTSNGGASVAHSCSASSVTSISLLSTNPTTPGSAVSWAVLFSAGMTGVSVTNFALVQAGGVTGATITSITGAGTTWTVNANTGAGTGTLGLNMVNVTAISPAVTTTMPFVGQLYNVSVVPPGTQRFDAVEVGGAIGLPIRTKIAGQAFNLDILAVKHGAINTKYKKTPVVDLIAGAALCDPATPSLAGVTVTPVGYKYTKGCGSCDNGRHTYTFTSSNAYPNVRVRVQDNKDDEDDEDKIGCSTDNFAIRPASFTSVSVTDSDWQTAGTTRALTNMGAGGGNVHKAGQPFTLRATAVNAANATTTNYAGTPTALLTSCAGTACTSTYGTLLATTTAVAGEINSTSASYSEVGSFALQLQDRTFANVDALDSTTAERYFSSPVINVGRFVPDHFDTVVVPTSTLPMPCPAGLICPTLYDGFIYSGQTFSVQVRASNMADGTTINYNGTVGLSKTVNLTAWDALGGTMQNPGSGMVTNGSVVAASFTAGVATTNTLTYTFATVPTTPADIYMRAVDQDSVTSLRTTPQASVEGGVKMVSGRLKIGSAHGSELLPLPMIATVQYWSGMNWVPSTTDNVTSFNTAADIMASIVRGPLPGVSVASAGGVTVVGGVKTFTLNRPLVSGSADISLSAPAYLLAGSNVAGVNPSLTGRATFGVYKGNNEFIYLRENY